MLDYTELSVWRACRQG